MKASDVPTDRLLDVIRACNDATCTIGEITGYYHGGRPGYAEGDYDPPIGHACKIGDIVAALPEFPEKVLAAKLRRLVAQGVIDGCTCGCRGDFEVSPPVGTHCW